MKGFRNLSILTAVAVYGQVVLGGVVRITGSGLGCRDWPLCYQHQTDRFAFRTLLEVAHRVLGTVGGLMVLATAVLAYVIYSRRRDLGLPIQLLAASLGSLGLYALQGVLGGVTVLMKNSPFTVALHLGNALLVLGALLLVATWATRLAAAASTGAVPAASLAATTTPPGPLAYGAMVAAFLVVVSGAYVVGSGAGAACGSWPLCGDTSYGRALVDIHMLHRVLVGLGGAVVAAALVMTVRRGRGTPLATIAYLGGAALLAEIAVGAVQAITGLPPVLRALHVGLASLAWSGTVLVGAVHWLERHPAAVAQPGAATVADQSARRRPAEARG